MRILRVGRRESSRVQSSLGLTLIELIVGMAVVGIILSLAVAGIRNFTDAAMKETASRLSSTIRYLYNKSATERLYLRIAYDFEASSYQVESSGEPFVIEKIDEDVDDIGEEDEESPGDDSEEEGKSPEGGFSAEESYLLKQVKLSENIYFKDVQVSYVEGKIEEGVAYTYFFPNGFATPTVINLRDEDDEVYYSLELMPLSGRVRIKSSYAELHGEEE